MDRYDEADGLDGPRILCDSCYDRGRPPHWDYVGRILVSKLGETRELAYIIANFAYPTCANFELLEDAVVDVE